MVAIVRNSDADVEMAPVLQVNPPMRWLPPQAMTPNLLENCANMSRRCHDMELHLRPDVYHQFANAMERERERQRGIEKRKYVISLNCNLNEPRHMLFGVRGLYTIK